MSQSANLYAWLADGHSITPLQAFHKFGTLSLHSRISELRSRGHKIDCQLVSANGKRVGKYRMRK